LATGRQFTAAEAAWVLVKSTLGGIGCGAVTGLFALALAGRTTDHLVEITLSTVAAYGSFLLAEHFGLSGVLATITAGLVIGNFTGWGAVSTKGREALQAFWEYAAFAANSLVFLLIGMRVAHQRLGALWSAAAIAVAVVLVARAAAVYPCAALFRSAGLRVSMPHRHVLFWGGLRGALALALALGLPPGLAMREEIVAVCFAVVVFSIFVQGLSMTPLLRRLGEIDR
jgi:CPA1 family monovalent cation:H+ antiporter